MQNYFIKAPCHQSNRQQGYQFAPDDFKQVYDFEISIEDFNGSTFDFLNGHRICPGYQTLHDHMVTLKEGLRPIVIGGDHSISASTLPAMVNKYPNLKILILDSQVDSDDYTNKSGFPNMMLGSILGAIKPSIAEGVLVNPENIIYMGVQDEVDFLSNNDIKFITLNKMKSLSPAILTKIIGPGPIFVSLDMKVFEKEVAPNTETCYDDGLSVDNVLGLLTSIKDNIIGMDISEYNPELDPIGRNVTRDLIFKILEEVMDVQQRKVNIFGEHTEFIIWRPMTQQEDGESDIGWYILRGVDANTRNQLLEEVIGEQDIVSYKLAGTPCFLSKTTIDSQNKKSYYGSEHIFDTALFPEEKQAMMFELLSI